MTGSLPTPWAVTRQAPLSMVFSSKNIGAGLLQSLEEAPGDLPDPGIEPVTPTASPALQVGSFTTKPAWASLVLSSCKIFKFSMFPYSHI